jgi:putative transferase (TIGR04331 family)
MTRHLITTSDERSWKSDRPVLFLGEWCRLYTRKSAWSIMDAVVAAPYGLQPDQKGRDIAYIQLLSRELLKELAESLNVFHNTDHSLRYWHLLLGSWLQRYVAVTLNRYATLEQTLTQYEISGTTVFDLADYNLATADSDGFVWACNDDIWNHVFYSDILKHWSNVELEVIAIPSGGVHEVAYQESAGSAGISTVKRFVVNASRDVLPKLSRKRDAFIINSYLPKTTEIRLQVSLGQCPQLWRSPQLRAVAPDPHQRQRFGIEAAHYKGFPKFLRTQLTKVIPTCYLEGYGELMRQVESLPWPTDPKFIFTSNNFDTDEIFKAWTGSKVAQGIPYFTGQHGNNYGTMLGSDCWPELETSDRFFTWGWANGSAKNIPAFMFKTAGRPFQGGNPTGGVLLIELTLPHRISVWDSYFEFGIYQEEQFRFVAALPESIRRNLTVRLKSEYNRHSWFDEHRWKDRSPQTNIETGKAPIQALISKSRLVIHSYDSTGILETLSSNIPTMCFWHGGLDHLLSDAKPYYEILRSAGILFDSPEQAAEALALRWDKIGEWWNSRAVQDALATFCGQYARAEARPVRAMKRFLEAHAKEVVRRG